MRTMTISCPRGHDIVVDRAIAWLCPRPGCRAAPGVMCMDLRGETPRVLNRPHPERTALRQEADDRSRLVNA